MGKKGMGKEIMWKRCVGEGAEEVMDESIVFPLY